MKRQRELEIRKAESRMGDKRCNTAKFGMLIQIGELGWRN